MKLNTGLEEFKIEFDNGDSDSIYFQPNDPNLATRLMKAKDNISKKLDEIKIDDAGDGKIENIPKTFEDYDKLSEEEVEALSNKATEINGIMQQVDSILREEIDKAFGSKISDVVFKHCSPLSIVGGEYFIVQFLNAIAPEIQARAEKASKESETKIANRLKKYKK